MNYNSPPRLSDADIDLIVDTSLGYAIGTYPREMIGLIDEEDIEPIWEDEAAHWPNPSFIHDLDILTDDDF